jgi:hypothetical protein
MLTALAAACDRYGAGPDDGDRCLTGLFYGTIQGSERGNPFTRTVNLHLTEGVGVVSGGYSIVGVYGRGSIAGTLSGSTLTFTLDQNYPCPGIFSGTASFTGDRLSGTYTGSSCRGDVTASFEVNCTPEAVPL